MYRANQPVHPFFLRVARFVFALDYMIFFSHCLTTCMTGYHWILIKKRGIALTLRASRNNFNSLQDQAEESNTLQFENHMVTYADNGEVVVDYLLWQKFWTVVCLLCGLCLAGFFRVEIMEKLVKKNISKIHWVRRGCLWLIMLIGGGTVETLVMAIGNFRVCSQSEPLIRHEVYLASLATHLIGGTTMFGALCVGYWSNKI